MKTLAFSIALALTPFTQTWAESRYALVIGNNAYQNARALVNPKNDAIAIAAKLRGVGFDVTERTDATNKGMKDALREFSGKVPEGSVCLIYYAGHGVQIKGQNYLVPVDAKMAAEYEVPDETLCMDTVVRALGETKSKLNIFVLDCCRDDPFARNWKGTRAVGNSGGLVMPADMPQGMFIAYATSPNTTAEDGEGNNSPYATALLEEIGQPGLDVSRVFNNVGAKVVKATNGKQEPWVNHKFYGSFSFVVSGNPNEAPNPTPVEPAKAPVSPPAVTPPSPPAVEFYNLSDLFNGTPYDMFNDSSKRQIIREAQQKLKNAGHLKSEPDGSPGRNTHEAILGFQRERGIPATGIIDAPTISALGLGDRKESSPSVAKEESSRPKREASNTSSSSSKPRSTATPKLNNGQIPRAGGVPGKHGYVFSPYTNRIVDVNGIPSGTLVQDPTSGKHFRVP